MDPDYGYLDAYSETWYKNPKTATGTWIRGSVFVSWNRESRFWNRVIGSGSLDRRSIILESRIQVLERSTRIRILEPRIHTRILEPSTQDQVLGPRILILEPDPDLRIEDPDLGPGTGYSDSGTD